MVYLGLLLCIGLVGYLGYQYIKQLAQVDKHKYQNWR